MPPKFREDLLVQSLEAGTAISHSRGQVARLGNIRLADARGTLTPAGRRYQELAPTYNRSVDLDPWVRGTETRGRSEWARKRSSDTQFKVGRWINGTLQLTKGYGEQYYGQFRTEMMLRVPVVRYRKERNSRGFWLPGPGARSEEQLPLHEVTLFHQNALQEFPAAGRMRELATIRDREYNPMTREEKWEYMLRAFTRYIDVERNSPDAQFNEAGNLILLKGSDWDMVLDDDTYLRAQQNETQGFLLEEMHARRQPGIGMIPMEVLIQRPLGNINPTPFEMHNKSGLYPLAFEDLKGECMSRQLQIAIVVREQKNGVCKMVPEFDLSELTKHGGIIDQACLRLANGDAEATYAIPTPAKDERIDALMPMAIAMEKWLKKVRTPQTLQQVNTFIRNTTLSCPELDYTRLLHHRFAQAKLAIRDEAFVTFP